jgi:hypothetical protein
LDAFVLALHVLQQGQRLAERAKGALHTRFPIGLRRCLFSLEQRPDRLRDVLRDLENFFRNFGVLLERFECLA